MAGAPAPAPAKPAPSSTRNQCGTSRYFRSLRQAYGSSESLERPDRDIDASREPAHLLERCGRTLLSALGHLDQGFAPAHDHGQPDEPRVDVDPPAPDPD